MQDYLLSFSNNPKNPKNIQIPFVTFIAIAKIWELMQSEAMRVLSDEEKAIYKDIYNELSGKKGRIASRNAYSAIAHAQTPDEKEAAYKAYLATKEFYT